jgi:hypothetical protein
MEKLSEHINKLPEGDSEEYLKQYKSTLGMLAELYFFNAVSISHLRGMEEGEVKALWKEVFKDRTITLPYEPEKDATIADAVRRYQEKEPSLNWIHRDLKERAKDTEKREDANNNTREGES